MALDFRGWEVVSSEAMSLGSLYLSSALDNSARSEEDIEEVGRVVDVLLKGARLGLVGVLGASEGTAGTAGAASWMGPVQPTMICSCVAHSDRIPECIAV